ELRERVLGKSHSATVSARFDEETARKFAARPEEDRRALAGTYTENDQAFRMYSKGRDREALALVGKALATRCKLLGEDHPDTATSYDSLGLCLGAQGKHAEAEEAHRKALALFKKLLGEDHPHTARGYNNLGLSLDAQGKHAEAEEAHRKALALSKKLLGEE